MKKFFLVAAGFLPLLAFGQTILSDDFESYTAGEPLAANSALWTTWSGGVAAEDADVSDAQSSSGSNSVYIIGNTGPTDLVLPFPSDYTSGNYELSMKMYVVSGKGAYFNVQQSSVPGVNWMFELYLDIAGGGYISAGGALPAITYTPDAWNDIKLNVDLDNDHAEFFMNGSSVYSWQWSLGATGGGAAVMMGGIDIFAYAANGSDAEFYVDDVELKSVEGACASPTALTVTSVGPTAANVEWSSVSDAMGYRISYHAAGSSVGYKKNSGTNSKLLKNLLPGTKYKWAVQSVCSTGPLVGSPYVPGPDFVTAPYRLGEGISSSVEAGVFPNPAGETATISLTLVQESDVDIRMSDMNGRIVQEITHAKFDKGSHIVTFTNEAPAGTYFLTISTNDEIITKRFTIVK